MALIACPECKSEVSSAALKCPKCGVQLRMPTRSAFGKLVKFAFIAFNVLMPIWIMAGLGGASEYQAASEAQRAGHAVGTGIGVMILLSIWVFGDIILGLFVLFTRPKS